MSMQSLIFAIAMIGCAVNSFGAQPPSATKEFDGKYVIVVMKNPMRSMILEDAAIRTVGNRSFVVGKTIAPKQEYSDSPWFGIKGWYALEECAEIFEFTTLAAARTAVAAQAAKSRAQPPPAFEPEPMDDGTLIIRTRNFGIPINVDAKRRDEIK